MPNSIDFRADQIQTKQIIVTGSGAGTTKLLIYGIEAQGSPVNEGLINTTNFPQTGIGGDVFLYVSGALNTKGSATVRGTSVFGGDLVVSGSLYNGLVTATGGDYSHAEGYQTIAFGMGSHASGIGTIASGSTAPLSNASIVQAATGRWNKRNNETSLFVVGNGTGDSDALRGDIFRAESTGELVLSGGIRHNAHYFVATNVMPFFTNVYHITKNDYLVIANTEAASGTVYLPEITDVNKDIGLTVRIRQNDVNTSGRTVTIGVSPNNPGYLINGFDAAATTLTLGAAPSGTNTNRSVTLIFMGGISSFFRWFVVETSTC